MKKWLLITIGSMILLSLIGFSRQAFRTAPIKPGVTEQNFRLLHSGMTKEQIQSILGKPQKIDGSVLFWNSNGCKIGIGFDLDDVATVGHFLNGTRMVDMRQMPKSFFHYVRTFLRF